MGIPSAKAWVRGDVTAHVHAAWHSEIGPETCRQYGHADAEHDGTVQVVRNARNREVIADSINLDLGLGPRLHDSRDEFTMFVRVRETTKEPHPSTPFVSAFWLL